MPAARNVPPKVAAARSAVGVAHRHHAPPDVIERARAELREAKAEAAIQRIVDASPPLTDAQRDKLALLLRPADADGS